MHTFFQYVGNYLPKGGMVLFEIVLSLSVMLIHLIINVILLNYVSAVFTLCVIGLVNHRLYVLKILIGFSPITFQMRSHFLLPRSFCPFESLL